MDAAREEMNRISEEITRLSKIWYRYVNLEHHKDRDCHWSIDIRWSYGKEPTFTPWHDGYIGERWTGRAYQNMRDALMGLLDHMQTALRREQAWARSVLSEDDYWNASHAKEALEILGEFK